MNSITVIGRLVKDPEIKLTQNSTKMLPFCIADNRGDDKKSTDFIDCLAWGKTADFINKWFKKGDPISVTGRLQTRSYTNKDGATVKAVEVWIKEVAFVPTKTGNKTEAVSEEKPDEGLPFEI